MPEPQKPVTQRSRPALLAMNAAVAGAAAMLAIVLSEIVLRLAGVPVERGPFTVTMREFDSVPGMYGPGQRLLSLSKPALPHRITINSLGLRGEEIPLEKPAGEWRVLFFGDSHAFGDYMDDEDAVPAQLQDSLRRTCAFARVINAGLSGSTIVDEFQMLRRTLRLDPDMVVIQFVENDVTDLMRPVWFELAENRVTKSSFPMSFIYPTVRSTALWRLLLLARGSLTWPVMPAAQTESAQAEQAILERELRRRYVEELIGVRDTLQRLKVGFLLSSSPADYTVSGERGDELLKWLQGVTDSLGIPYSSHLDRLLAEFARGTPLFLLPHDNHPNRTGYAIAAGALASRLAPMCTEFSRQTVVADAH